jgi:type II secretory pathway pseudopilin PulG
MSSFGLPSLPPLVPANAAVQSLEQLNQSALQDALQQYQTAAQDGVPGMTAKVAAAQNALASYGASPTATPASTASTAQTVANGIQTGLASLGAGTPVAGVGSFLQQLFGVASGNALAASGYLVRGVAIVGGLVLIAGAVFGFRNIGETSVTVASGAVKKGAELAAV